MDIFANVIRQYRHEFGITSPIEDVIRTVSCDYSIIINIHALNLCTSIGVYMNNNTVGHFLIASIY